MTNLWQGVIVGLMVTGALVYLLRKYLPRRKAAKGCKACGGCKNGGCH